MKVLLVWTVEAGENRTYLIEDPTEKQLEVLEKAHDAYINLDDQVDSTKLVAGAVDGDDFDPDAEPEWKGIWQDKEVKGVVRGPIDMVVVSGWFA
jgi:hypothetical protein